MQQTPDLLIKGPIIFIGIEQFLIQEHVQLWEHMQDPYLLIRVLSGNMQLLILKVSTNYTTPQ